MRIERPQNYSTALRLCAVALLFALPFERIPSVDVAGITIRLSTLLLLGVTVFGWVHREQLKAKITKFTDTDKAIGAYLAVIILTGATGVSPARTLKVSLFFALTLVGYLLVSHFLQRAEVQRQAKRALYLATSVAVVFGLYQFIANSFFGLGPEWTLLSVNYVRDVLGFARVQSVALEPLYFANFLLLPLALLAADIVRAKSLVKSWKHMALFGLSVTALVLTVSRGAYLASLAAGIIFLWLTILNHVSFKRILRPVVIGGAGLLLAFSLMTIVPESASQVGGDPSKVFISHGLGSAETRSAGVTPRLETYKSALRIFRDNSISGIGLGNFALATDKGKTDGNQEPIVNNMYLEVLAETGLLGAVALSWVVATLIKTLWRQRNDISSPFPVLALGSALAGLLVQYNFFSTIYILFVWVLVGLIAGKERSA